MPETARTSETLEVRQGTQGARCHLPCFDAWRQGKSKGKIHGQSCRCDRPCFDAGRAQPSSIDGSHRQCVVVRGAASLELDTYAHQCFDA